MSDANEKHTVSVYFVNSAVNHLTMESRERALAASGIQASLLDSGGARVPATAFSALWLAVARELNDEFFGLDSRSMKVGGFALICQAVISCQHLDQAVKRMLRGFAILLDDIEAELLVEGDAALIQVNNRIANGDDRRFAEETLLILVHGLMCWLIGRRIPIDSISFAHSRPQHWREHTTMFSDAVEYNAEATTIRFDGRLLAAPVAQTAPALRRFLRTAPQSVFLKYRNEDSWTAKLRQRLRGRLGELNSWPVLDEIARAEGTTETTLRRRLEREGTSYQQIKDQLRSDIAIDYLCNSNLSVDEISGQLGFQDTSAFHRAFKRWNGLQPGEYRKRQGV